jgi:hypothetical protein
MTQRRENVGDDSAVPLFHHDGFETEYNARTKTEDTY